MGGISQDMKKQDNKFVLSNEENMVGNQHFMTTEISNEHVEKRARHQANHKVSYSIVTEIEMTTTTKGCTHEVWMKKLIKDYVISEEVLTPNCENLEGIGV